MLLRTFRFCIFKIDLFFQGICSRLDTSWLLAGRPRALPKRSPCPIPQIYEKFQDLWLSFSIGFSTSFFPDFATSCQPPLGPLWPLALLTVALPLANPTPLPLVPLDLNMGAFLQSSASLLLFRRLELIATASPKDSAYLNISGTIKNRTWLPLMYT